MNELEKQKEEVNKRMSKVKHKIVVMSGKGGVGKTTVAVNLAITLSSKGYRVGLMDADIHGPNVPNMLGIENKHPEVSSEGISPITAYHGIKVMSMAFLLPDRDTPVIWRGPMKMGAIRQFLSDIAWSDLDYLIIDLPPGTGDEPLSIAQLIPNIDGTIIVTTPQDVALLDSRKAVMFAKRLNMPIIGIVENMSGFICPRCGEKIDIFKVGGGRKSAEELGVPFIGAIPFDIKIVEAGDSGFPFYFEENIPAIESFKRIADKVEEFVSRKNEKKEK